MNPSLHIVAGPNGAGKTTFAREFLPLFADCTNFINADLIAAGIAPLAPDAAAVRAGRLMLAEIERLAAQGVSFGFETTLAGLSHLHLIQALQNRGYSAQLYYLWLPTPELALARIRARVAGGGHDVPAPDVERRYQRSLTNYFRRYRRVVNSWLLFDNSGPRPDTIAVQNGSSLHIIKAAEFNRLERRYGNSREAPTKRNP